jgi:type VI secretion system protein VasG
VTALAIVNACQSQLDRLRPLLDAQSDERPEMQREAELAQSHGGGWSLSGVRLVQK